MPCTWLNGKHVVFGRTVEGFEVLDALEEVGSKNGKTEEKCEITNSGQLSKEEVVKLYERINAKPKEEEFTIAHVIKLVGLVALSALFCY